jgi:hypothetical protein
LQVWLGGHHSTYEYDQQYPAHPNFKFDEHHDHPRVAILSSNSARKSRSPSVSDFTSGSVALRVIATASAPGLFDVGESLVIAAMTTSHASCASRRSRFTSKSLGLWYC